MIESEDADLEGKGEVNSGAVEARKVLWLEALELWRGYVGTAPANFEMRVFKNSGEPTLVKLEDTRGDDAFEQFQKRTIHLMGLMVDIYFSEYGLKATNSIHTIVIQKVVK